MLASDGVVKSRRNVAFASVDLLAQPAHTLACKHKRRVYFGRGPFKRWRHALRRFGAQGKKEDGELRGEFLSICGNGATWGYKRMDFKSVSFDLHFVDKKVNSTGLQLADLTARPIMALSVLRPDQPNRAAEIVRAKGPRIKVFP